MTIYSYILLPLVAGGIGWFTNWIAIKMLFHPRKKIKVLFFEIQGIFPKRQALVAEKIGQMVANELLSVNDIRQRLNKPGSLDAINDNIEDKIEEYLEVTFPAKYPVVSLFMGKKARVRLKDDFMHEVHEITPMVVDKYMDKLENDINIEQIVKERVSLLSPVTLEKLLMGILKKEFQFVEWVGAALGLVIGVVQILIDVLIQHNT
ncbi:MAG: DUF445 family protein [Chitinophagales bacterium]|nr:DUF445 family protein [Chitinophagales bacterium]